MLRSDAVAAVVAIYVILLVTTGWMADRRRGVAARSSVRPILYALSLATLCSAWIYFGAVGGASQGSWLFAANALGPIIAMTAGYPMWRRIAVLSKQENVGSLADFLAARYGKSRALGILSACVATLGALPYIALQIDVLTGALAYATGKMPGATTGILLLALLMGIAIVFGARRPSLTQHNRGFISLLALEACVKIVGLLCVAGLSIFLIHHMPGGLDRAAHAVPPVVPALNLSFFTLVLLCTVTAFTLPRQFHLGFVALEDVDDVRTARWLVPAYFVIWSAATVLIAIAVRVGLGSASARPEFQVIGLPLQHGKLALAMLALLGGISAGAAMVVVETTATSAMISNELILPLLARAARKRLVAFDVARSVLLVRRVTIVVVGLLAWLYYMGLRDMVSPNRLGMTALTAFAQFVPALVGGIYWRGGHARGAIAGISAGAAIWAVAIAAPALAPWPAQTELPSGHSIAAITRHWPVELAVILSLLVNGFLYVLVSLRSKPSLLDTIQARTFVEGMATTSARGRQQAIHATISDIRRLLGRFLGEEEAERALFDLRASSGGARLTDSSPITPTQARMVEKVLAGVIGAPSARNVVSIAISADGQSAKDIDRILDEAAHAVLFSRELLQTTLDSLSQAVSVVDGSRRLVAWNANYARILDLPTTQIHVGKTLAEVIGGSAGTSAVQDVRTRLLDLNERAVHSDLLNEEWQLVDGRTLQVVAKPLAKSDYLTTLTDISDLKAAGVILSQDKEVLEQRVRERTRELSAANEALAEAKLIAERASNAQNRFVATASHDLVQPLHAARLFIGNALSAIGSDKALGGLLQRADQAVDAAHGLLRALLSLSQLETGAREPNLEPVDASELLRSLGEEFASQAQLRNLELIIKPTRFWVMTDQSLIRSMLQNLLLNALRYTPSGRIVVIARRAESHLRFEVRDTGIGISPEKIETAFGEYSRLAEGRSMSEGAGLGLAIVARIGQVLKHPISVRSRAGKGSVFAIAVPLAKAAVVSRPQLNKTTDLGGLHVLCIDDEPDVLLGTKALIERWGGIVDAIGSGADLVDPLQRWDVAIADHHLPGEDGLSILRRVAQRAKRRFLLTATPEEGLEAELAPDGIKLLRKPISPLLFRQILSSAANDIRAQVDRSKTSASS